ncbi:aminotransferase class IV family protein [Ruegeria sp. 2205SS24-7]|uniref:aminotransferase class IV family protein n=1 Tax=Ruegeria discodermiae TaxID=3064389 RepID=UPI002740711E|nr:aminotransferase class IV family protein [Ruegeria sp. 2205SS24-7]MDP5219252.1 aminotransferase class IV family protein [Ruegeria sp. 2205SS24-7]
MESPLRHPTEPDFRLIETLGIDPARGFVRLDQHLDRMAHSARVLGISFDRAAAVSCLNGAEGDALLRCRLTLDASGAFALATGALTPSPALWRVAIAQERLNPDDPWLRHKTTRRALYDTARAALPGGVDEWLFLNTKGELCEGTITNLFVTRETGEVITPPLSCGLLPGILRQEMLMQGAASEQIVTLDDLRWARLISMGNSLRGLIQVELVESV